MVCTCRHKHGLCGRWSCACACDMEKAHDRLMMAQPRGRRAAVMGGDRRRAGLSISTQPLSWLARQGRCRTWMTGAGLARPVVSMMMASNLLRRFSSLFTVLIRSPRTAAHGACRACTHVCVTRRLRRQMVAYVGHKSYQARGLVVLAWGANKGRSLLLPGHDAQHATHGRQV